MELLSGRLEVDAESGKRIERLKHEIAERLAGREPVREERARSVRRLQIRQRMLADPEIPVRMSDPFRIDLVLEAEAEAEVRATQQFIENDAVVDALDPHLASVTFIEQLVAAPLNLREANRRDAEKRLGAN